MICKYCFIEFSDKPYAYSFCGVDCYKKWHYREKYQKEHTCSRCGLKYVGDCRTTVPVCRSCQSLLVKRGSGPDSPTWKGGHRFWQAGKLGRDKNGFSWKSQRKLAWERDHYTCQECGEHREGWKPHVHHISPYRISFSHALENLICLCNSCHKKAEAQIKELWGGKSLGGLMGRVVRVSCRVCGSVGKKLDSGLCEFCGGETQPTYGCVECGNLRRKKVKGSDICFVCQRHRHDIPKAKLLREQGVSYEEIAIKFGVTHKAVWRWVNGLVPAVQCCVQQEL